MKHHPTSWLALLACVATVRALEPTAAPLNKRQLGLDGNNPFLDPDGNPITNQAAISSLSVSLDRQFSSALAADPADASMIRSAQSDAHSYLGVISKAAVNGQGYATASLYNGDSGSFDSGAQEGGGLGSGAASASMPRATPTGSTSGSGLGSSGNSGNVPSFGTGANSGNGNGAGSGQNSNQNPGSGSSSAGPKSNNSASQIAVGGSATSIISLAAISLGLILGAQAI